MTQEGVFVVVLAVVCAAIGFAWGYRWRGPKPYAVLTEAQAVKLYSAAWAMGYGVIDGMPIVEDAVRGCYRDISDVLVEVDFPDMCDAIIRQGQKEQP